MNKRNINGEISLSAYGQIVESAVQFSWHINHNEIDFKETYEYINNNFMK